MGPKPEPAPSHSLYCPGCRIHTLWPVEKHRPSGKYFYPVHQISDAFKARFLDSLKRALRKQKTLSIFDYKVQQAYKTKWVVHCEPSLAGADHVVKYLGQYTHRVVIKNQRILNIKGGKVTFIASLP